MARTIVARSVAAGRVLVTGRGVAPTIPPDPTPPVDPELPNPPALQGTPAPVSTGQTSVALTSSWDQYCQAFIAWDTVSHASWGDYAHATDEETSFRYTTHIQTVSGLAAGTTYHYRWVVTNSAGQRTVDIDRTFTTAEAPSSDVFTDYTLPTGAGWTDGSDSIAAVQAWVNANVPNGTGPTDQSRILLGAGLTRIFSKAYDYTGDQYIRWDGQGTPVHVVSTTPILGLDDISQSGNTNGCIIRITSSGSTPGITQMRAAFAHSANATGPGFKAVGLSWVGIRFEGNGTSTPSTSMGDQGVEHQAGIWLGGVDGGGAGVIEDCTFRALKGDAVVFNNAGGSYDLVNGQRVDLDDSSTIDYTMRRCDIRYMGRVGLFPGDYDNVTIEDTVIQDCAYAFIDFEPDYYHMRPGTFTARRVTFGGTCNWDTTYYMAPIFVSRIVGRSPGFTFYFNGLLTIDQCVFRNRHGRNGNGSAPASNATSDWPWEVQAYLGPITKTGGLTVTGCERVGFTHTKPFAQLAGYAGAVTVTGNRGFGVSSPATSFVTSTGGTNPGGITQSGND